VGPGHWGPWHLALGQSGQGQEDRACPTAPTRSRAARGTGAPSPRIEQCPEDGHGLKDVVLRVRVRNRPDEGKQGQTQSQDCWAGPRGQHPVNPDALIR